MYETSAGCCPLCGNPYHLGGTHGQGICSVYSPGSSYSPAPQPLTAPAPLTADDVRRIVREELERAGRKP